MQSPISPDLERALARLHPLLVRWASARCDGDVDEGADLVQELYLRLLDGRLSAPELSAAELSEARPERLKRWCLAVLRRLAAYQRRRLTHRLSLLKRYLFEVSDPLKPNPEERFEVDERAQGRQRALERALSELSARQREVIELVFEHELTVEESAEVMGVSVGSARVHYDRAKRRLSALLSLPSELQEDPQHEPPSSSHPLPSQRMKGATP